MTEGSNEGTGAPVEGQPSEQGSGPAQGQATPTAPPSWDELFDGEDPGKVREALDQSRKWETRAKTNADKARQYDEVVRQQKATMTEADRAVAEAKEAGRLEAQREYGTRLAQTEFQRLAALRNPEFDAAARLEFIDQSKFVTEDGELDAKVIRKAVDAFVPEPTQTGSPSFDGGARTQSKTTNMNDVIRGLVR